MELGVPCCLLCHAQSFHSKINARTPKHGFQRSVARYSKAWGQRSDARYPKASCIHVLVLVVAHMFFAVCCADGISLKSHFIFILEHVWLTNSSERFMCDVVFRTAFSVCDSMMVLDYQRTVHPRMHTLAEIDYSRQMLLDGLSS